MLPPELRAIVADLVGELLAEPADVLHCYIDDCNVAGAIAEALTGTPKIVLSLRNGNPTHFPGLFRPWMRPCYLAVVNRPGIRLSANSAAGARDYERWLGLLPDRVPVIRNAFVPSPRPSDEVIAHWRKEQAIPDDSPVVAGVFRLEPEKRPHYFLECVALLRQLVPNVRVVLAGVGSLERSVRARITALNLDGTVTLLGQRSDIPALLGASDVLLLVSDWEGTPNALLEAQHAGCVPVATDAGGSGEALDNGRTGLLVGLHDREGTACAVAALLTNPARRREFAEAGPAFVAECFAPTVLHEANERLYRTAPSSALTRVCRDGMSVA